MSELNFQSIDQAIEKTDYNFFQKQKSGTSEMSDSDLFKCEVPADLIDIHRVQNIQEKDVFRLHD